MNLSHQSTQTSNCGFDKSAYDDRMPEDLIHRAHRNHEQLTKLINRLFDHHSRLLVIRVDLGYQAGVGRSISLESVQMHREQLLGDRRTHSKEFGSMLGYAWGLEYGQETGYHYHLLAFYNGAERRSDIGIGFMLSNLWSTITNGTGWCYISNRDKERLASQGCLGIGMISRHDLALRSNLIEKVAAYITKKCTVFDVQSSLTESGAFRTFGKSHMPPLLDQNVIRRGRPRTL